MGIPEAIGFGVSALQAKQAHDQASIDAEIAEAQRIENNEEAQSSMLSSFRSLEDEADQLDENFISNDIDRQKMEAQARGSAVASSGASGQGGSTLDMQLDNISVSSSTNQARNLLNRQREMSQIKSKGDEAVNVANARFNRMPVQKPKFDFLSMGISGFRNTIELDGAIKASDKASRPAIRSTLVESPVSSNLL